MSVRPGPGPDPDRLTVTAPRALGLAALFGLLAGWLLVVGPQALGFLPPQVPPTAPLAIAASAVGVGIAAWSTHQALQVRRERMDPQRAVAFLVLGKASALGGALISGGYLSFGLQFVARWEASAPRDRVVFSVVSVLAGVGLTVAGLLLERACRVPRADPDEDDDDPGSTEHGSRR